MNSWNSQVNRWNLKNECGKPEPEKNMDLCVCIMTSSLVDPDGKVDGK